MTNPDHAKRLRQRIETMNKLRGRPLTNVEKLANIRCAFDEEDAMNKDHAKRVLEHQEKSPVWVLARHYSVMVTPSPAEILKAQMACQKLVEAGYTIVRLEDAENEGE